MQAANPTVTAENQSATLYAAVRQALRLWHETGNENPLAHLLTFQQSSGQEDVRHFVNSRLLTALETMACQHADAAKLLRMRYLDGMTADAVAYRLGMSTANLNKKQKRALYTLAAVIQEQEDELQAAHQACSLNRLEAPTYDRLFGVDALASQLLHLLATNEQPWLVVLEGIGGIGKTALADAVMRQAIAQRRFAGFGWVSARQQRFHLAGAIQTLDQPVLTADQLIEQLASQLWSADATAMPVVAPVIAGEAALARLTTRLKTTPHLIVVDNLETMGDLEALLPTLQRLANPTKFLLTSRVRLYSETATYPFAMPELGETDALALVRHEAALRNQPDLAGAAPEVLQPIYATVGGNPLALRLIVGQTRIHTLDLILSDLKAARGQAVTELYTYIYRYAWEHLDDLSRRALIAMPFAPPHGATVEHLVGVSQLPAADLRAALQQLVTLNLVNRAGALHESRYTIHSLTRTFLLEQVVQWIH
ncbi:MAG: ATP-binding protein [Caldilineaceae bacterium]